MKDNNQIHTTNYFDTFIEVAPDTKATAGTPPITRGDKKTVAALQYEIIRNAPYQFTSDDVLFQVFAYRYDLLKTEHPQHRADFFSKGQACMRASPLTKTHGFGIHCNADGKLALYGMETATYQHFIQDDSITKIKAMRTSKK